MSPARWLPRTGISSGTLRSVIEYGRPLPFLALFCRRTRRSADAASVGYARVCLDAGGAQARRWSIVSFVWRQRLDATSPAPRPDTVDCRHTNPPIHRFRFYPPSIPFSRCFPLSMRFPFLFTFYVSLHYLFRFSASLNPFRVFPLFTLFFSVSTLSIADTATSRRLGLETEIPRSWSWSIGLGCFPDRSIINIY